MYYRPTNKCIDKAQKCYFLELVHTKVNSSKDLIIIIYCWIDIPDGTTIQVGFLDQNSCLGDAELDAFKESVEKATRRRRPLLVCRARYWRYNTRQVKHCSVLSFIEEETEEELHCLTPPVKKKKKHFKKFAKKLIKMFLCCEKIDKKKL